MGIRFGPAGIPLSCKGRTLKDGIEDIHALQLDAMEVQLLRPQRDIPEDLDLIRELGEELDVKLTVHAPYYMDLLGDKVYRERSVENIIWSAQVARRLGSDLLVTHIGMYHNLSHKKALEQAVLQVRALRDRLKKEKLEIDLGLVMSGRQKVFGTVEEILTIVKRVQRTVPVLNIPNIHARTKGSLIDKQRFEELFEKVRKVTRSDDYYIHFSGVEHSDGDKIMNTPVKKGDLRFDPLAELMLDMEDSDFTVVSESPLLEHDAVYMKLILDRIIQKRSQKEERQKDKGEEAPGPHKKH